MCDIMYVSAHLFGATRRAHALADLAKIDVKTARPATFTNASTVKLYGTPVTFHIVELDAIPR